jgi:peptidoglycan hydrolase-like protein with peptidoglycan-binding domain
MRWKPALLVAVLAILPAAIAVADELTQIVQKDLTALGYDTGGVDGKAGTKTVIAVSRFQAEHGLAVTGEITPQLAGRIQAELSGRGSGGGSGPAAAELSAAPSPGEAHADLEARRELCLQEKIAEARQAAKLKSGLSKLLSAVSRTASRYGDSEVASQISTTASDAHSINASVSDLEGAARDLGISQSDIDACRNPG